jgi:MFS family permease
LERDDRSERYRWVILAIVYLSMLDFGFFFLSIPPILPFISNEFHLNYTQSGLLMGLFAFPGIFISLWGGFLSDRYGMRSLASTCFLTTTGGILFLVLGRELWVLWAGRIIIGMGAFVLSILLPKILSQWFERKELGLAMGIFNTGVPLGSVLCFALFGKMATLWGWRVPLLFIMGYSVLAAILFLALYRSPSHREPAPRSSFSLPGSLKQMGFPIWWVGFAWLAYNAGLVSFSTFAPDFFLQQGYPIERTNFLVGIPLLGSLFLSPLIGYLIDRFPYQGWFIGLAGLGLATVTLAFNFSASFLLLVIVMGFCSGFVSTSTFSLPSRLLNAENVGLGFGILSTCASAGLFGAPYLVGKFEDLSAGHDVRFLFIPFFYVLVVVFTYMGYRSQR